MTSDPYGTGYYARAARRHGGGPRAVGWSSRQAQRARFSIIERSVDLRGARVLDVGCGLGALYDYLHERGLAVDYVGIDPVPELIRRARRRLPRVEFHLASLETARAEGRFAPHSFDVVVASGVFARHSHCTTARVVRTARSMYGLCRRAVVFNALSARLPGTRGRGYRLDPARACKALMGVTPELAMRQDPRIGDVCFVLWRPPADLVPPIVP